MNDDPRASVRIGKEVGAPVTIRVAVLDSEMPSAELVSQKLACEPGFECTSIHSRAVEALTEWRSTRPDAVFLDVNTLLLSGVSIDQLRDTLERQLIVLLARDQALALKAFEIGAIDCLLKPVQPSRLNTTLERIRGVAIRHSGNRHKKEALSPAQREVSPRNSTIVIADRKRVDFVDVQLVDWIKADGDYTEIHVRERVHLVREPLNRILQQLPESSFCKIHRSVAVNLDRISGYVTLRNRDLLVKLRDATALRASRTFSDALRTRLNGRHSRSVGSGPVVRKTPSSKNHLSDGFGLIR